MNIITNNTKKIGLTILSTAIFSLAQAQEKRILEDYTGIKVGDSFEVIITQSETNSIMIESDENKARIKTEIKDGVLYITSEGKSKSEDDITLFIESKKLEKIIATGSAEIKTKNQLISDNIYIESSGVGDVSLDITASEIKTNISGAGDILLKGKCNSLDASVSGAGSLKATYLEAEKVVAKVSGAGDAKVNAKQSITADVSGAGSIIYKGNPVDRNVNISGAGSVRESKSGTGEETARDTTKIKLGNKKYMIIDEEGEEYKSLSKKGKKDSIKNYNSDFKNWTGFEIGINGYTDAYDQITMPAYAKFLELDYSKSIQFGLNLLEKDFHIYKNYVNLVVGFGFDFNHYAFKNSITLNGDTTYLAASIDNIDYKKNKLNVSYIKAPLMLEFNTSKNANKNLHIAIGAEFAYRIHAVTKQKYDLNDTHHEAKRKDDFLLNPFRYSAVARIGYNDFSIFAEKALNTLFQEADSPDVYPFTLGVCFSF